VVAYWLWSPIAIGKPSTEANVPVPEPRSTPSPMSLLAITRSSRPSASRSSSRVLVRKKNPGSSLAIGVKTLSPVTPNALISLGPVVTPTTSVRPSPSMSPADGLSPTSGTIFVAPRLSPVHSNSTPL